MSILTKLGLTKEVEVDEKTTEQNPAKTKSEVKQNSIPEQKNRQFFSPQQLILRLVR